MKKIFDHIDRVREKPHHVRRQIAFATAAGMTGLVAVVWLASNVTTGVFAINGSNFAQSTGAEGAGVTVSSGSSAGLAGAGAALDQGADAPAHIEIVDTKPAATTTQKADPTVIPF